jgi:hypothetical protein
MLVQGKEVERAATYCNSTAKLDSERFIAQTYNDTILLDWLMKNSDKVAEVLTASTLVKSSMRSKKQGRL